ncbi:hypothetical protein DOD52_20935 [Shigella flexneri]|nr:hypothetical protein [Shigella flexneri]
MSAPGIRSQASCDRLRELTSPLCHHRRSVPGNVGRVHPPLREVVLVKKTRTGLDRMCVCRTAHAQSDKRHQVRASPRHPGQHHSNKIKRARARFSASFFIISGIRAHPSSAVGFLYPRRPWR